MNSLYVITTSQHSHHEIMDLFATAASARGITLQRIAVEETNYTQLPVITRDDLLYRASTTSAASILFKTLITQTDAKILYKDRRAAVHSGENVITNTLLHAAAKLPIIKTIFDRTIDKILLEQYVQELGGFPIILKTVGESHGRGIHKVGTIDVLIHRVHAFNDQGVKYILRAYIPHRKCARLIVLGDQVIDSICYDKPSNDFRTNAGEIRAMPQVFSPDIESLAIKAVKVCGAEFGGVDVLISDTGEFYLAEVNTPCFFPRAQQLTGTDIAGHIIDYLLAK